MNPEKNTEREVFPMAIIRYPNLSDVTNPFKEMLRLRREMERLFADVTERTPYAVNSGVFPALDITEHEGSTYVHAELPGVRPEDLEVSVEGRTLTLRGERKPDSAENVSYHRRERKTGRFHKAISLPHQINAEDVTAGFKDGVLELVLPKVEEAKPKRITVQAE
jgi:HSP20 family protein